MCVLGVTVVSYSGRRISFFSSALNIWRRLLLFTITVSMSGRCVYVRRLTCKYFRSLRSSVCHFKVTLVIKLADFVVVVVVVLVCCNWHFSIVTEFSSFEISVYVCVRMYRPELTKKRGEEKRNRYGFSSEKVKNLRALHQLRIVSEPVI